MGLLKRINSWVGDITRKRQILVEDEGKERWSADVSPFKFVSIVVAIVTLIFGVLLLLVAYTPLLDLMPGYRTNAAQSREILIRSNMRVDSLERMLNDMLTYNENRILVVNGKTPAMHSVQNDSLQNNKEFVAPSKADSLLRKKMETNERYRLSESNTASKSLNAVAPMSGIISERFNSKELLGIRMNSTSASQVSAVAEGVVVSKEWSPEAGHSVVIQHKNNFLSVYRNLTKVLVSKGEQVKSAQAIASIGGDEGEKSALEFELWHDGKAVNPELYIVF